MVDSSWNPKELVKPWDSVEAPEFLGLLSENWWTLGGQVDSTLTVKFKSANLTMNYNRNKKGTGLQSKLKVELT